MVSELATRTGAGCRGSSGALHQGLPRRACVLPRTAARPSWPRIWLASVLLPLTGGLTHCLAQRAARRAPRHPHAPGSAQRAAPPPLPPERELPAPKTPPDSLRTTFTLTRPSAWPPRARRPPRLPVRLTQAFRDCPGQVLSRRMPGVAGPSPLTPHGPPFGPVQDVPVEGTTAGGPSVTDGRIVSAGRSAVRLSRESKIRSPLPRVAARVPGSRPPIAAEVGGLEPSAPRVASDGQTLSRGQSSHLFVPSALWES